MNRMLLTILVLWIFSLNIHALQVKQNEYPDAITEIKRSDEHATSSNRTYKISNSFLTEIKELAEYLYSIKGRTYEVDVAVNEDFNGVYEKIINNFANKRQLKYSISTGDSQRYHKLELKLASFVTPYKYQGGDRYLSSVLLQAKSHGDKDILIKFRPELNIIIEQNYTQHEFKELEPGVLKYTKSKSKPHWHPPSHEIKQAIDKAKKNTEKSASETGSTENSEKQNLPVYSPQAVVENSYTASVLFLFDRNLMNSGLYNQIRLKLIEALSYTRNLMYVGQDMPVPGVPHQKWGLGTAYYKDYKGWNIFGYEAAPASLCPTGACTTDYAVLMARMATDKTVATLRQIYNADFVMYIHEKPWTTQGGEAHGAVNRGDFYTSIEQANERTGVINYYTNVPTFTHEFFHFLGAGHSSQTDAGIPGIWRSGFAHTGSYISVSGGNFTQQPYKTFMEYQYKCDQRWTKPCLPVNRLSTTYESFATSDGYLIPLGSLTRDNHFTTWEMFPKSVTWSHYYNTP